MDHVRAEPAKDGAAHALRMGQRKDGRDARAHGVADDIGLSDFEMVEQRRRVLRHGWAGVAFRIVELIAGAVAAIVERDGAETVVRRGIASSPYRASWSARWRRSRE